MSLIRRASRVAVASSVQGRAQQRQQQRWARDQWEQADAQGVARVESSAAPTDGTGERIAQLQALGELRASGVLTEAEFEAEKRKLLGA